MCLCVVNAWHTKADIDVTIRDLLCPCAYMEVPLLTKPSPQSHYLLLEDSSDAVICTCLMPACLPQELLINIIKHKQLILNDLQTYQIHSQN